MRECIVTIAENMSEDTFSYLCKKITEKFGEDIRFTKVTNNAVLGGFIMELEGTVFDLSVATQLGIIKEQLNGEAAL